MLLAKKFIPSEDVDEVKETIARYFEEIDNLFKYFSGFCGFPEIWRILRNLADFAHYYYLPTLFDYPTQT